MGLVNTAGKIGSKLNNLRKEQRYTSQREESAGYWLGMEHDLTDEEGYFLNYNGERSFVVHQADRFGSILNGWLWQHGPLKGLE